MRYWLLERRNGNWESPGNQKRQLCARVLHGRDDRMPVVLADSDWDCWIDTAFSDTDKLSELLRPRLSAPKNQGPELIEADRSVAEA